MTRMRRSVRLAVILFPAIILGASWGSLWALYYIILLGVLSLTKVIYYSLTFNNCELASESLKKEIIEARIGLAKKGFRLLQTP